VARLPSLPFVPEQSKYWPFQGGLDQVTPTINIPPGRCRSASNMEIGSNGTLIVSRGYERFSGQPKPSDATYYILPVTITGSYAVGNTVTGATSGATGVILAGTSTYFVLTKVTGTFQAENIQIAAVTIATSSATATSGSASTRALDASYKNLAADLYRADIAAVPGEGDVLGVWKYNGNVYAVRNAVGSATAAMYKQSVSGWSLVGLGRYLAFTSGGTTQILAGDTITGATSAATAVVGQVVKTSGTWAGGDAAGFIYFASQTGTFQAENLNIGASLNVATISGNSTAVTLSPSGRYEFVNYNFGGTTGQLKMYGCSGTHKAFEWDGTTFAFITTGMTDDTPNHITAHKKHLFLAFDASVQHSGIGDPLAWSVVLGAAEIAMGDDVTGFLTAAGSSSEGALVIYTRNSTFVLYGNSSSDWNLITFNAEAGALEWTAQYIGQGIALDDRGVTLMSTSQVYGNFSNAEISALVRPYLNARRDSANASCVVREKNQYRLFFSGGDALYVTFIGNKVAGLMPISLTDPVTCICSLEGSDGVEEVYFGSDNGFVYQMEVGTSHDGEPIDWSAELVYNHFGSPRQLKQFRKAIVEVSGDGYATFSMAYNVGYGTTDLPQGVTTAVTTALGSTQWDNFVWDSFYWDGQSLTPSEADLDGTAENISIAFSGSSDEFEPITLNGAIVHFTPRRGLR
jgi:hypothetical protein